MANYATPASSGEYWAETIGREEQDDASGGFRIRKFEGRYSTSGIAGGSNSDVLVQPLPVRGAGYPGSSAIYFADTITRRMVPGNENQWEATVTYVPVTRQLITSSDVPFADLPRSWSIGGELLQFADTGDYYYVNIGTDNDPIKGDVPAFRKIATGRYTVQEVVSNIQAARTRAKASVNTKNDKEFEGVAKGDFLYLGFESDEFTDSDGEKKWRLRHNFLERDIPGTSDNGWEYVLRDDTAEWAYIQISPAADEPLPIYPSSSFPGIFAAT